MNQMNQKEVERRLRAQLILTLTKERRELIPRIFNTIELGYYTRLGRSNPDKALCRLLRREAGHLMPPGPIDYNSRPRISPDLIDHPWYLNDGGVVVAWFSEPYWSASIEKSLEALRDALSDTSLTCFSTENGTWLPPQTRMFCITMRNRDEGLLEASRRAIEALPIPEGPER